MNTLIKNGTLVTSLSTYAGHIWIEDQTIRAVEDSPEAFQGVRFDSVIDAEGLFVLPGIIDAHTHYLLESRGTVTADDFFSASAAGAVGGVTTAVDFADQKPGLSLAGAAKQRIEASERDMAIDFGLHQCIFSTPSSIEEELTELKSEGITTVKIFTTYKREGYFIGEEGLKELFAACLRMGLMVTAHCEDDDLIDEISASYLDKARPPSLHPVLRPAEAEYRAVKMIGEIAGEVKAPIYIVHLSSSRGADAVRELRRRGVQVAVETTPHYLLLTEELLKLPDAQKYIMTPPLRSDADRAALWSSLENEEIQIIATDHCTFTAAQKMQSEDCTTVLPGIPGTEELLPLIYSRGVGDNHFDIRRLVSLLSEAPARYFGLFPGKGSLIPGTDADIVLFDPEKEYVLENENRHTKAGYTPYAGTKLKGMPVLTMLRGEVIARNGQFTGRRGFGRFLPAGRSAIFGV